ncbi:MAG: hypothetical protein WAN65_04665 [Candidatus Sulfotelmatobacter sp.]
MAQDPKNNSSGPQAWNYVLAAIKAGKANRLDLMRRLRDMDQDTEAELEQKGNYAR